MCCAVKGKKTKNRIQKRDKSRFLVFYDYQEAVLIVRNYRPSNTTYVCQGRNHDFFSGNHKRIEHALNWLVRPEAEGLLEN